ncbi:MAG: N-6 DNA methylase [Betaproteobacteria bacterium RIFCSPLOWO2_12_FULL_66_14]|nr:MAG: N-6 DNA methylase [Betaproteobacteria bacterium RIFCSPLOWO2_12_FULL_66_14]
MAGRKKSNSNGANIGYEAQLWQMADALRGSMDAAEYKHVVLGLIFLKYISDAFEELHAKLEVEKKQGADPEDPDEYRAKGIFWVPPEARWSHLKAQAKQPTVGQLVDDAMAGIERDNPSLKAVLPKEYARPALDKQRLGQLIDLVSNIKIGDAESRSKDVLGRVYEYFLSQFASAEGKKGGEFYTPRCVVKLLVEMLEPFKGRVYDPCCGSSGMFVQSEEFIVAHGGKFGDISIYGQESNYTTWRLAKMNLAIRGIEGKIEHGDTFHNDRHPDLKADYILANPPFNVSDWGGDRLREDKRWRYGAPPPGNANFAWVQHIVHHLSPTGLAGFVLANGSMSSNQSGEGDIRRSLVEADLVDCMVALPGQLFYSTQIPACLWFLARDKRNHKFRERRGHILFIDARKLGKLVDRTHRELTDQELARIAKTYHAWRGEKDAGKYEDIPGFCKSAPLEEIRKHGHVLTPGRYVGAEAQEDDGEPFEEKMQRLAAQLREQQKGAASLDAAIAANLKELGYGG